MAATYNAGVKRDIVREQENINVEVAAHASQSQSTAGSAPRSASGFSKVLSYCGIGIAFMAAVALIGLGFGMWKASSSGNGESTLFYNSSAVSKEPFIQQITANTTTNATGLSSRYFESSASFLLFS